MQFSTEKDYDSEINFPADVRAELNWSIQNIQLNKGKTLIKSSSVNNSIR